MIEEPENKDPNIEKDDDREGKGRVGSGGRGGGTGSGGGIRLPPNKLKEIMANWEHLDVAKTIARVAEFFNEMPARASANVVVAFNGAAKFGFALVNHFMSSGFDIRELVRERTAGHMKRLRTQYGVKMKAAPAGIPGMVPTNG